MSGNVIKRLHPRSITSSPKGVVLEEPGKIRVLSTGTRTSPHVQYYYENLAAENRSISDPNCGSGRGQNRLSCPGCLTLGPRVKITPPVKRETRMKHTSCMMHERRVDRQADKRQSCLQSRWKWHGQGAKLRLSDATESFR
jgi:hypothetical protein